MKDRRVKLATRLHFRNMTNNITELIKYTYGTAKIFKNK